MSCINLIKPVKLFSFRILQYRHIQSYVSSASFSYLFKFRRQNLKYFIRINKCTHVPSVNIQTSKKYFESSENGDGGSGERPSSEPQEDFSKPLVQLTYIKPDGEELQIEGRVGLSVMRAALNNKIPMEGACEGQLGCTTCHVYVEEGTEKFFEGPGEQEEDMLDNAFFLKPNSRLSCQLKITEDLENARFHLPKGTANFSVDGKIAEHS